MASSVRVLLVDEDEDVLAIAEQFLERADEDFAVTTAASATAALERVDDRPVDAVVTDYRMPETDGISLAEAVRDRCEVPVFLFTARHDSDLEREVEDAPVAGYVTKRTGTGQYAELAAEIRDAVGD